MVMLLTAVLEIGIHLQYFLAEQVEQNVHVDNNKVYLFRNCTCILFMNKKTCVLSRMGSYKLELFSCGHLDSRIFFFG